MMVDNATGQRSHRVCLANPSGLIADDEAMIRYRRRMLLNMLRASERGNTCRPAGGQSPR